jgi:hypothetical protein
MREKQKGKNRLSRFSSYHVLTLAAVLMAVAVPMALRAQVLYGSLTGNITDPSDAPVSGAHVEALNSSTGITKEASLGGSGGQRQWWFGGKLVF